MNEKENQESLNWMNRFESGIRKGMYKFSDVGVREWKEKIKDHFMVEINDGTATDRVINATVEYFCDQIKRKRITIEDVPEVLREKVKEGI